MTAELGEQRLDKLAGLIIWGAGRGNSPSPPAELIRGKPIFIGVGEHDDEFLPGSKEAMRLYKDLGADVIYEEWPNTKHGPAWIALAHATKLGEWLLDQRPRKFAKARVPLAEVRDRARAAEQAGQLGHALTLYQQIGKRDKSGQFGVEAAKAAQRLAQQAEKQLAFAESAIANRPYAEVTKQLKQIAKVYANSIFATRANKHLKDLMNTKAAELAARALAAEKAKNHTKALQLYKLYLTHFRCSGRSVDAIVHVVG